MLASLGHKNNGGTWLKTLVERGPYRRETLLAVMGDLCPSGVRLNGLLSNAVLSFCFGGSPSKSLRGAPHIGRLVYIDNRSPHQVRIRRNSVIFEDRLCSVVATEEGFEAADESHFPASFSDSRVHQLSVPFHCTRRTSRRGWFR